MKLDADGLPVLDESMQIHLHCEDGDTVILYHPEGTTPQEAEESIMVSRTRGIMCPRCGYTHSDMELIFV